MLLIGAHLQERKPNHVSPPMPAIRTIVLLSLASSAVLLGACQRASAPAPVSAGPGATPSTLVLPEGSGCGPEIGRFRTVISNDKETGNANKSVADKVLGEIDQASSVCAAGRDGEALRMVAQTKSRYGYR